MEIIALAALGYWGFKSGEGIFFKILLALGAPLLMAIIWGLFIAPHATYKVSGWLHLLLEIAIFGLAAASLFAAGNFSFAWAFVIAVLINRLLMLLWK